MAFHTNVTKAAFLHFAHPQLYHPIYLQVPAAFDFPQFELILLFLLMTGVVKNATAVLFDPLNSSAGHTTIPAVYFFAALAPFVFFALCMLSLFKFMVSRLTPNLGSKYVTLRPLCALPTTHQPLTHHPTLSPGTATRMTRTIPSRQRKSI